MQSSNTVSRGQTWMVSDVATTQSVIMELELRDHRYTLQSWGGYGLVMPAAATTNGVASIAAFAVYRATMHGFVVVSDPYALASLIGPDTGPMTRALADLQREFESAADAFVTRS